MLLIHQATDLFHANEAASLPELLEGGRLPALFSGLPAVSRAHLAAVLRAETQRPVLVLCPDESAAEAFSKDAAALLEEPVPVLTARDFTFYTAESVSRQTEQKRLGALYGLAAGKAGMTVCTVSGLLQRAIPKKKLLQVSFTIEDGGTLPPEDVEDALIRCGYVRTQQVEGPGQFSRRGGILDFFSPAYTAPVRIEFWGDEIDSMGFFDLESQRRTESVKACQILPAAETLLTMYPGGSAALGEKLLQLADRAAKRKNSDLAAKLSASLREDGDKLRAGASLPAADRYMGFLYDTFTTVLDYLPEDAVVLMEQPARCTDRAKEYAKQLTEDVSLLVGSGTMAARADSFYLPWSDALRRLSDWPVFLADSFTVGRYPLEPRAICGVTVKQLPSYGGSVQTAADDIAHYLSLGFRVVVLAGDFRRAQLLRDFLDGRGVHAQALEHPDALPAPGTCLITAGSLSAGMEYPHAQLAVLTDTQIAAGGLRRLKHKAMSNRQKIGSYADLSVGDLVVHEYHGIGRFAGIVQMPVDGAVKDYIKICYAGSDSLYVPATQLDMVSKYIGTGEDHPVKLSKMGGTDWHRAKTRAKAAAKDLAKGLTALYAERAKMPGHAFAPDSPWQTEFEERFGYLETDDQLRCIAEIKADMEKPVPMDRLLCGDVGYGKTEVALRAVMKCVLDGCQAAILVPTTVLAQQHYQTAVQRFFGFPVEIQMLSRFCTPAQVRKTLADLKTGKCDLVIGTHKLLQKSVEFKNLGLLIVDEEQRFGVAHKEHIKEMSRTVDVLTLSATPIPRTLNMALSGIRDMSTLEEPPQDRMPVQTFVMEHDWNVLCDAMRRELQRGGQVYYLHNRIENIERTALKISKMLDGATVAVAHGQMNEEELSNVMESVAEGKTQILVCTTIIETGIDIPNVNTLIIEDADRMGLAQLHQLRGRVGRSNRRASAYLTFRRSKQLTEIAEKRLSAIREFAEFNSGFRIAMRDLEIRGAGNLLGAEQSGHLIDVGYDMYLKLLEEAVLEERGEKPQVRAECSADLAVSANIPEDYVPSQEQRMDLYRRIALVRTEPEADDLMDEIIDRFGDPPPSVNSLLQVALLRGEAGQAGITDISQKNGCLKFLLSDFDMQRVSALYARPEFKGRLKVDAGQKPGVILRLKTKNRVIEQAREFISAWADVRPENQPEKEKRL